MHVGGHASPDHDHVGIELEDPRAEKKVFRLYHVDGVSALLSDIGMPYLNLGAIGQKPQF